MSTFSRRSFIAGVATVPFAVWLEKNGVLAQPPRVRPNVMSAQGQAMLTIYSNAAPNAQMNPQTCGMTGGSAPFSNVDPLLGLNFIICIEGIFPSRN